MKMKINDKEYLLCDCCGAFKSSERCYNCFPLKSSDDICEQLKPYFDETKEEEKIFPVRHHLLEYYFTREQLMELGLYYGVPDWQILITDNVRHHRILGGINLHKGLYKDDLEYYRNISETEIKELIDRIPSYVIKTFEYKVQEG